MLSNRESNACDYVTPANTNRVQQIISWAGLASALVLFLIPLTFRSFEATHAVAAVYVLLLCAGVVMVGLFAVALVVFGSGRPKAWWAYTGGVCLSLMSFGESYLPGIIVQYCLPVLQAWSIVSLGAFWISQLKERELTAITFQVVVLMVVVVGLEALLVLTPLPLGTFSIAVASMLSSVCVMVYLLIERIKTHHDATEENQQDFETTRRESTSAPASLPLADVLNDMWAPLVGTVLVFSMFGFGWGSEFLGTPIPHNEDSQISNIAGQALGCVLFWICVRYKPKSVSINALIQVLLPLASASLLLTWMLFQGSAFVLADHIMGIGLGMSLSIYLIGTLVYIQSAITDTHMPANAVVGIVVFLWGMSAVITFGLFIVLGDDISRLITPVGTVAYLCALCVWLTQRSMHTPPAAFAVGIEDACKNVAVAYGLSPRESEVLTYLARGRSATYIADALTVSPYTIKTHTKHIHEKLGVASRQELIDLIEQG